LIISFLIKKNIITLVPINETFFHCTNFLSDKKLSYESVVFNYQKLSPYVNSAIAYVQNDDKLLLWFFEKSNYHLLTVPEGFLYYQYFLKKNRDAIISVEDKIIIVIQQGILRYQSIFHESQQEEIEILSKKYNIQTIINKSSAWHEKNHKKILNQSLIQVVRHFLDKKLLIKEIKEKLSLLILPVAILLTFVTVVHLGINYYLQKEMDILTSQKQETKLQTKEMFDKISLNNENILLFKKYLQKHNQTGVDIFTKLSQLLRKYDIRLYYVQYDRHFITFRLECDTIEGFLEELSTIDQIKAYKLTRQIKSKKGKQDITIEVELNFKGKSG